MSDIIRTRTHARTQKGTPVESLTPPLTPPLTSLPPLPSLTPAPITTAAAELIDRHRALVAAVTDSTFTSEALDAEHSEGDQEEPISRVRKVGTFLAVVIPPLGLIAAMILLWGTALSWVHLALLLVGYVITGLGITVGYHRLFTHKSFDAHPVVKAALGVAGSMALEGPILFWVSTHRLHHQHSDRALDPHSPHVHTDAHGAEVVRAGILGRVAGALHAHFGWLFKPEQPQSVMDKYIPDLLADPMTVRISKQFLLWALVGLLLPMGIAWAVTGSVVGGLLGLLWGGLVRIFMVHHITWSVNSVCHIWGSRPFKSHDHSRNNPIVGVLAFGEGWHNAHHAFPASARHGLRWWEFDFSYVVIKALELVGLVKNVRLPNAERLKAKQAGPK